MTSPQFDLVVLGDINLDWVVTRNLPFAFEELKENGRIIWLSIQELPGGSGLNFANHAVTQGLQTLLLGSIGGDTAGRFISSWLKERNIHAGISVKPSATTGKALMLRDANDIRLLVNNVANANGLLSWDNVAVHSDSLRRCSVLYVSGYCVNDISAPRYQATLDAMNLAACQQEPQAPVIVFDVVPHRIYETFDFNAFKSITQHVDVLIAEVATIRRFLGMGERSEQIDEKMARSTAEELRSQSHYLRFILRYGPSGCDFELMWNGKTSESRLIETGHAIAGEKRGFGDALALRSLREYFRLF